MAMVLKAVQLCGKKCGFQFCCKYLLAMCTWPTRNTNYSNNIYQVCIMSQYCSIYSFKFPSTRGCRYYDFSILQMDKLRQGVR